MCRPEFAQSELDTAHSAANFARNARAGREKQVGLEHQSQISFVQSSASLAYVQQKQVRQLARSKRQICLSIEPQEKAAELAKLPGQVDVLLDHARQQRHAQQKLLEQFLRRAQAKTVPQRQLELKLKHKHRKQRKQQQQQHFEHQQQRQQFHRQ